MRTFRSDNNAGLCPEALRAIVDSNDGSHETAYGDDRYTAEAVEAFRSVFGAESSVWFVATGTAANTLAIASLTSRFDRVICAAHSHYNDDESTAPERIAGCRCVPLEAEDCKLTMAQIEAAGASRGDVHQPRPGVVTISNVTEFGTVYTPDELRALCEVAHALGYRVHVDGARFANAVAAIGCSPRELSVEAGVDALSFGGTKNGLAAGEAVLFFPQGNGAAFERAVDVFPYHRKSTGHLVSKHRFVTAPFTATLRDDIWLAHAAHSNEMARRLERGLRAGGIEPRFSVQANGVFVPLPDTVDRRLREFGHGYYPFGDPGLGLFRLMCSFDTAPEEVDQLLEDALQTAGG